jgi:hypothetical protein
MQLSGYRIPRMPPLGTWVNKGKKREDRGCWTPALLALLLRFRLPFAFCATKL